MPLPRRMFCRPFRFLAAAVLVVAALLGASGACPAAEPGRFVIDDDGHDLRASASAKAAPPGAVFRGETVTGRSRQGGSASVRTPDGRRGGGPGREGGGQRRFGPRPWPGRSRRRASLTA